LETQVLIIGGGITGVGLARIWLCEEFIPF